MTEQPLVIERVIEVPPAGVWQALTDINELEKWLPFWPDFKAEVGFKTDFMLGPDAEHQSHHHVEVLEVAPGQKLSYSWDYGGMSNDSSVSFELSRQGDKTKLVLDVYVDPLPPDQPDFLKNVSEGWNHTADGLRDFVENN